MENIASCHFHAVGVKRLFWLFKVIHSGITVSYQQTSLENLATLTASWGLVVKGGQDYSQKDFLHLVRQSCPDAFIFEKGNEIMVNGITFSFESGKLRQVHKSAADRNQCSRPTRMTVHLATEYALGKSRPQVFTPRDARTAQFDFHPDH